VAKKSGSGQSRGRRPRLGYAGQAATAGAQSANTKVQQAIADPRAASKTAAGFVLGVLADVLLINYLKGGFPQVKAWLAAKFLNRVGSTSTTPAPAPATGGGGGGITRPQ